jgi:Domain of unknown function (DUF4194)
LSLPIDPDFSAALIALMCGIVDREDHPAMWQRLLDLRPRVTEYVAAMGLELIVDEAEGYGYLRQRKAAPGETELPRLVARRQLGYSVSLLLALLRRKLAEFDADGGDARLVLEGAQITEVARMFFADTPNEAKLMDRVETDVKKIVEMGFLRRLRGSEDRYEVRRMLKSFVDAQWLAEFEKRLSEYKDHASGAVPAEAGALDT